MAATISGIFRRAAGGSRYFGGQAHQVRFRRADCGTRDPRHPPDGNRRSGSILGRSRAAAAARGRPNIRCDRRGRFPRQERRRRESAEAGTNVAPDRRPGAFGPDRVFSQWRRDRGRIRRIGRRDRRRRLDPHLWRVPPAILGRGSSAAGSKPSSSPSTACTRPPTTSSRIFAAGRSRRGSTATRSEWSRSAEPRGGRGWGRSWW